MTFDQVLPGILAGKIARVVQPRDSRMDTPSYYVKSVDGVIEKSVDNSTYTVFTTLYNYTAFDTWELLPINTVSQATVQYSTLTNNWDAIVYAADPAIGSSSTSSIFREFAQSLGF